MPPHYMRLKPYRDHKMTTKERVIDAVLVVVIVSFWTSLIVFLVGEAMKGR